MIMKDMVKSDIMSNHTRRTVNSSPTSITYTSARANAKGIPIDSMTNSDDQVSDSHNPK